MPLYTSPAFWISLGYISLAVIFSWSYYDMTERLNYAMNRDDISKTLYNQIGKFFQKYEDDMLMLPTILTGFMVILLKTILMKHYITRFLTFLPTCAFFTIIALQNRLLKSYTTSYEDEHILILSSSILASIAATFPNLYLSICSSFSMGYVLSSITLHPHPQMNTEPEYTSIIMATFLGLVFLSIMNVFGLQKLDKDQLRNYTKFTVFGLIFYSFFVQYFAWIANTNIDLKNKYAFWSFVSTFWLGGGTMVNIIVWSCTGSKWSRPHFVDTGISKKQVGQKA